MLGRGAIHHICRQAHPAKLFREIAIPPNAEGPTPGNGCESEQQGSRPAGSTTCSAVEQSARNQIGGGSILSRGGQDRPQPSLPKLTWMDRPVIPPTEGERRRSGTR